MATTTPFFVHSATIYFYSFIINAILIASILKTLSFVGDSVSFWITNDLALWLLGIVIVHEIAWSFNFLSYYSDKAISAGRDPFGLKRFKLSRPHFAGASPSEDLVWKSIHESKSPRKSLELGVLFLLQFPLAKYFGIAFRGSLPSFATIAIQIFCFLVATDFIFYWVHRVMHMPRFYPYHKKHHEFKAVTGFSAEYEGAVEATFATILPVTLLPIFIGTHFAVLLGYVGLKMVRNYLGHGGYAVPWLSETASRHHDAHHLYSVGNFATCPFWDLVFGTAEPHWLSEEVKNFEGKA